MSKIKVCITVGTKKIPWSFGEQATHLVSYLYDRKSTIKLLRQIEGGNYWNDLALDYIYKFKISDLDNIRDKDIDKLLINTTKEKWEKFVRVFTSEENTTFEIKTITI
jgi:hypothetical protein